MITRARVLVGLLLVVTVCEGEANEDPFECPVDFKIGAAGSSFQCCAVNFLPQYDTANFDDIKCVGNAATVDECATSIKDPESEVYCANFAGRRLADGHTKPCKWWEFNAETKNCCSHYDLPRDEISSGKKVLCSGEGAGERRLGEVETPACVTRFIAPQHSTLANAMAMCSRVPEPEESEEQKEDIFALGDDLNPKYLIQALLFLIFFTIVFENTQEWLTENFKNTPYDAMVHKMQGELTILGALAFIW
jgi:hypothetical protein